MIRHLGTQHLPITSLTYFPGNARRGNVGAIRESVRRLGQYRSVVVRQCDSGELVIIAGNHTVQALEAERYDTVRCEMVECTDDEARRANLADNRMAELGGYDDDALASLLAGLDGDYEGTGWSDEDLSALLGDEGGQGGSGSGDPDNAPPPAAPVTVLGDLWQLGPHRLLCGDAADVTAHDRLLAGERPGLIYTDPPYGMGLDTSYSTMHKANEVGSGGNDYRPVIGDDQPYDAAPVIAMYDDVAEQFWWGADYYRSTIPAGGSWIVWDKRANEQGMDLDKLLGAHFELCWSRQRHHREIARILWSGHHGMQHEDTKRRVHPTQKPVGLAAWFFDRWRGEIVLDLYGGSGSTLIAAHAADRRARVMELDPAYCDVICRRFQEATGIVPERVGDGGATEPADFIGARVAG